jgi:hypothetical protein
MPRVSLQPVADLHQQRAQFAGCAPSQLCATAVQASRPAIMGRFPKQIGAMGAVELLDQIQICVHEMLLSGFAMPSCLATEQSLEHKTWRHIAGTGYRVGYSRIGTGESFEGE